MFALIWHLNDFLEVFNSLCLLIAIYLFESFYVLIEDLKCLCIFFVLIIHHTDVLKCLISLVMFFTEHAFHEFIYFGWISNRLRHITFQSVISSYFCVECYNNRLLLISVLQFYLSCNDLLKIVNSFIILLSLLVVDRS